MNAIWTLKMGNCPFHEWYQEWSTYASRSGANNATKMFAFRQALPQGLNDKLVGVSPAPTTFNDLVDKAHLFNQQWQMWRRTGSGPGPTHRSGPRIRNTNTEEPGPSDANVQVFKAKKLTKEERDKRGKNNKCFYCGKPGHFARECRSRPNGQQGRRPHFNPARTHVTETGEEAPSELTPTEEATVVASLYHDPQFHFEVLDDPANITKDF